MCDFRSNNWKSNCGDRSLRIHCYDNKRDRSASVADNSKDETERTTFSVMVPTVCSVLQVIQPCADCADCNVFLLFFYYSLLFC